MGTNFVAKTFYHRIKNIYRLKKTIDIKNSIAATKRNAGSPVNTKVFSYSKGNDSRIIIQKIDGFIDDQVNKLISKGDKGENTTTRFI